MSASKPDSPYTLLAVVAHPDDESFGMGGTLALYARRGVNVHLVCATGGESGTVAPEFLEKYDSIAELRAAELRCAAETLGLASVTMLSYRDSGMAGSPENGHPQALVNQPLEEVAARLAHLMRQLRPQVVVTHDPIGGYRHPDHIALHKATVRAFHTAGDPRAYPDDPLPPYQPQKLYFQTFPKGLMRLLVTILRLLGRDPRRFGRNHDIDLLSLVEEGSFPIHARVNIRAALKTRDAASACHASQLGGGPPNTGLPSLILRFFIAHDHFMRAYPPPPPGLKERDLFAGINNA
jgi:LmbE family N-acetylglucosaminyl deacetylase